MDFVVHESVIDRRGDLLLLGERWSGWLATRSRSDAAKLVSSKGSGYTVRNRNSRYS